MWGAAGAVVLIAYGFVPTAQPILNFGRIYAGEAPPPAVLSAIVQQLLSCRHRALSYCCQYSDQSSLLVCGCTYCEFLWGLGAVQLLAVPVHVLRQHSESTEFGCSVRRLLHSSELCLGLGSG